MPKKKKDTDTFCSVFGNGVEEEVWFLTYQFLQTEQVFSRAGIWNEFWKIDYKKKD